MKTESTVFIPLLLGTNRKDRESEKVAKWIVTKIEERDDLVTELFDVRDFRIPYDDYGPAIKDDFPEWRDAIVRADGLIIVTPEYNHSYPGALKSVLDLLLKEYIHKAVAFVGVSAQVWGGTRVIEAMVPMVRELGLTPTFTDLNFPQVKTQFDGDGNVVDPEYDKRVQGFLDELVWMAKVLRWGRNNLTSKHHP